MNRLFRCASVFSLLLCPVALTRADDTLKDNEYYPLQVGNSWDCKAQGQALTIRVAKHEKIDGKMCAVLETVLNGGVVATETISADKDGVYRHMVMGQKAEPAVMIMKSPPKEGDSWKIDSKLGGQELKGESKISIEDIDCPAGNFKKAVAVVSELQVMGQTIEAKIWYAKDVGPVRTQMTIAGNKIVIDVEKFNKGK